MKNTGLENGSYFLVSLAFKPKFLWLQNWHSQPFHCTVLSCPGWTGARGRSLYWSFLARGGGLSFLSDIIRESDLLIFEGPPTLISASTDKAKSYYLCYPNCFLKILPKICASSTSDINSSEGRGPCYCTSRPQKKPSHQVIHCDSSDGNSGWKIYQKKEEHF